MIKKLPLASIALLIGFLSKAQFNDSTHYHLRFASTGVINKTNESNSYVLKNNINFNAQKKNIDYDAFLNWVYGAQQNELTNNDFTANGNIDFNKGSHKLYYWGLINYDESYSLNVTYRLQAGAGIAYKFIDSPKLKITVSDGFLFEKGNLIDENLGHDVYAIPRNSFRLSYRWNIYSRLLLEGVQFYQPSLLAINDYIIQSTNNISIKLNEWFSITGSLIYNKVSRTQRENLLITYGVTVEKYF